MDPGEEFSSNARASLMQKLHNIIRERYKMEHVSVELWAALWLCDLDSLQNAVHGVENGDALSISFLVSKELIRDNIIKPWMQRGTGSMSALLPGTPAMGTPTTSAPASPAVPTATRTPTHQSPANFGSPLRQSISVEDSPAMEPAIESAPAGPSLQSCTHKRSASASDAGSPRKRQRTSSADLSAGASVNQGLKASEDATPTRSEAAKRRASKRDNNSCVLTSAGRPLEIAHIYPFSMWGIITHGTFWALLKNFWSEERIERWKKSLFTEKRTEICENLISMSPNGHAYWGRAYYALKPIEVSEDQTSMKVQFFWLQKGPLRRSAPLDEVPSLPSGLNGANNVKLHDNRSDKALCSGDFICFTTDDPVKRPLPSKDLLEMQWFLHRLTALCGGAEAVDYTYNPDDPGDDYQFTNDQWDEWDDEETTDSSDDFAHELTERLTPLATSAA